MRQLRRYTLPDLWYLRRKELAAEAQAAAKHARNIARLQIDEDALDDYLERARTLYSPEDEFFDFDHMEYRTQYLPGNLSQVGFHLERVYETESAAFLRDKRRERDAMVLPLSQLHEQRKQPKVYDPTGLRTRYHPQRLYSVT